jgi:hypothetical protein
MSVSSKVGDTLAAISNTLSNISTNAPASTALNAYPWGFNTYNRELMQKLSPEARQELLDIYRKSIMGLAEYPQAKTSIKTYLEQRQKTLNKLGLSTTETADVQKLEENYDVLDKIVKEFGATETPGSIQKYLQDERNNTLDVIKTQYEADQNSINNSALADKDQALATLKTDYEASLKALQGSLNEDITRTHEAVSKERDRIYLLGLMRQNDTMRKAIDTLSTQKQGAQQATSGMVQIQATSEPGETLSSITLDEVIDFMKEHRDGFLRSPSGNRISISKTNGVYTIDLHPASPEHWLNDSSKLNYTEVDWLFSAQLLRATGAKTVTATVTCDDEQQGLNELRKAYHAALEAGFPRYKKDQDGNDLTDKPCINLVLNGRQIKYDDLYKDKKKDYHGGYENISEHYAENTAKLGQIAEQRAERLNTIRDIKAKFDALRAEELAKRTTAPAAPAEARVDITQTPPPTN